MKFQARASSHKQKLLNFLVKVAPVQPEQRSTLNTLSTIALYFINYLTLLYIIVLGEKKYTLLQLPVEAVLGLVLARAGLSLAYVLTKFKFLLVLQRLCLFFHAILQPQTYSLLFLPLILLDIASCCLYTLTIEQRSLHFDSRLFLTSSLFKQLALNMFCILWISMQSLIQFQSYHIFVLLLILSLDLQTYFYRNWFRKLIIGLDVCCIVSSLILAISKLNTFQIFTHIELITLLNILATCLYTHFTPQTHRPLYTLDPWHNTLSSSQILSFFFSLHQLTKSKENSEVLRFIVFHTRQCGQLDCFLRYHDRDAHHRGMGVQEVLDIFRVQEVLVLASKYPVLREYLVFNFEDRADKVRGFMDLNNFFHLRENQRLYDKIKNNSKAKTELNLQKFSAESLLEFDLVPLLKKYTTVALQFWSQLLLYKANSSKIIESGAKRVKIAREINEIMSKKVALDSRSQSMAHYYFSYLLGELKQKNQPQTKMQQIQDNLTGFKQASPTILVSAQKQNFLSITNANIATVKATGFTKSQLTSLKVDALWQKQIREDHIVLAQRRARYSKNITGQLIHSYAFLKNKFGYLVITDAVVYYFDDLKGKKWCVVLDPYLEGEAFFVVNVRREVVGVGELAGGFGLGLGMGMDGWKMRDRLFGDFVESSKPVELRNRHIFEDNPFVLHETPGYTNWLKFQTKIDFMHKPCYYVFTLHKKKQKPAIKDSAKQIESGTSFCTKRRSSLNKTKTRSEEGTTILPNFEFRYDFYCNTIRNLGQREGERQRQRQREQAEQEDGEGEERERDQIYEKGDWEAKGEREEGSLRARPRGVNLDQGIIEMRFWEGKIDFLENLQSAVPVFESFPAAKGEIQPLDERKVKQDFQTRQKSVSKQKKWLRIFFISLLILSTSLTLYLLLTSSSTVTQLQSQLQSHKTLLLQHSQLLSLSQLLISQSYQPSPNLPSQLSALIQKIDQTYRAMDGMDSLKGYMADGLLVKADGIYRLLVKGWGDGAVGLGEVVGQLVREMCPGWEAMARIDFGVIGVLHDGGVRGLWGFVGVAAVFVVVAWLGYLKFRAMVQQTALQMSQIFLALDHRAIVTQVRKLKSFDLFLDLDQALTKQQTLQQPLNSSQTANPNPNLYPKKPSLQPPLLPQTVLFLLFLSLFSLYFSLTVRFQYRLQNSLYRNIEYLHYSREIVGGMEKIWVMANGGIIADGEDGIEGFFRGLYQGERSLELVGLEDGGWEGEGEGEEGSYREFWMKFSYAPVGEFLDEQGRAQLEQIITKGRRELFYSMLRTHQKLLTSPQNYPTHPSANLFHKIHTHLLPSLSLSLTHSTSVQSQSLSSAHKASHTSLLLFILALGTCILWYWLLGRKIGEVLAVEQILFSLPWGEVEGNGRYRRFWGEVRVVRR